VRYLAWAIAGVLLAAAVHVARMSPAERARILQVAPAGEVTPAGGPAGADGQGDRMSVDPPASRAPAADAGVPGPAWPRDTGSKPPVPAAPVPAVLPSGLVVPVQGVQPGQLSPTFDDARGDDRRHDALDIMAPAGTPVVAVADGHVEKLFDSRQGGLTIYQFEPGGRFAYYYAHLDRYAPGLAEQQPVRRGQVIGYVGSTGNARPDAPHLHFAVFVLGPEKHWWEGTAIDPYPLFAAAPR